MTVMTLLGDVGLKMLAFLIGGFMYVMGAMVFVGFACFATSQTRTDRLQSLSLVVFCLSIWAAFIYFAQH